MTNTGTIIKDLSEQTCQLLCKAAVFGRSFSIDWLIELTSLKPSQVLTILDECAQSGWLDREKSGIYSFASKEYMGQLHEILTVEQKNELRSQVKQLLQNNSSQDPKSVLQAAEFLAGGKIGWEDCDWLIKAADIYSRQADDVSAKSCYSKVLEYLKDFNGEREDRLFISTVDKYFNLISAEHSSHWITGMLKQGLVRAERLKHMPGLAILNIYLANNQWQQGAHTAARKHFEQGWSIVQDINDPIVLKHVASTVIFYYVSQGLFRTSVAFYEESVLDLERFPKKALPIFSSLSLAVAYNALGQVNKSLGLLESIFAYGAKIKHSQITGWATAQIWETLCSIGRIDEVHGLVTALDDDTINRYENRLRPAIFMLRAYIYALKKDIDNSAANFKFWFQSHDKAYEDFLLHPEYLLGFTWEMKQGRYPGVKGLDFDTELKRLLKSENIHNKGVALRYEALLQKHRGDPLDRAIKTLNRSLKYLSKSGHQLAMVRTRVALARTALEHGDEQLARQQALKIAKSLSGYPDLPFPHDLKFLISDFSQKADMFDRMIQLNQDISTISSSQNVLRRILATFLETTGAERGAIFLLDQQANGFEAAPKATQNLTAEDIDHPDFEGALTTIKDAAESGQGIIRKINLDSRIDFHAIYNMRSCLCVPMIIRNETVGILYADNRFLISSFLEADLKMHAYFAIQAAIAMDNAKIYDEVNRLNRKLNTENRYYMEQQREMLGEKNFIGRSPAVRAVLDKVQQVARTDTTVLILGETGVGKELAAGMIMENSRRSSKPYITVNCSAFSRELISSELFGHEKGAFTGAVERRVGRFELADGGTLFLDEIGDIPMDVQVKLLRVLQTGEFERVGGMKTLRSDFRLIAATNRDMQQLVKEGRFREDLFYRLNVFPIEVPPLRSRKEDIPLLAKHFFEKFTRDTGKTRLRMPESSLKEISAHYWPGNVRELSNFIERSIIMSPSTSFRMPELKVQFSSGKSDDSLLTMQEMEKQHILRALEQTGFKISGPGGAAEMLDINHSTLFSRMKKHGIKKISKPFIEPTGP